MACFVLRNSLDNLLFLSLARQRYAFLEARMQRKIFWMTFAALGLLADLLLPFWWAVGATAPILALSWWIAYRSGWF